MDKMPIWWLDGITDVHGKLLLKVFIYSLNLPSCGGEHGENSFLGRFMVG